MLGIAVNALLSQDVDKEFYTQIPERMCVHWVDLGKRRSYHANTFSYIASNAFAFHVQMLTATF